MTGKSQALFPRHVQDENLSRNKGRDFHERPACHAKLSRERIYTLFSVSNEGLHVPHANCRGNLCQVRVLPVRSIVVKKKEFITRSPHLRNTVRRTHRCGPPLRTAGFATTTTRQLCGHAAHRGISTDTTPVRHPLRRTPLLFIGRECQARVLNFHWVVGCLFLGGFH